MSQRITQADLDAAVEEFRRLEEHDARAREADERKQRIKAAADAIRHALNLGRMAAPYSAVDATCREALRAVDELEREATKP